MIPHASYQLFRAGRQLTPVEQREADAQIGRRCAWLSDTLVRLRRSRVRQRPIWKTMKHMVLVCGDDPVELTPKEGAVVGKAREASVGEMEAHAIRLQGDRLRPVVDVTTVRVRDGEVVPKSPP